MDIYPLGDDEEPVDPTQWTQKEKDQYRFGGFRYSFRGPEYPDTAVPQIGGLYPFPIEDKTMPEKTTDSST